VRDTSTHLWTFYPKSHVQRSTLFFEKHDDLELPPIDANEYEHVDAVLTEEYYKINKRTIKQHSHIYLTTPLVDDQSDIQYYIRSMEKWHQPILKNTIIQNNNAFLTSHDKTIVISTDGGAKDGRGSFGIVISIDDEIIATNNSRTPPIYNNIRSYSTERYGILCGLTLIHKIQQYCLTQKSINISTSIRVHSDSQSMIDKINRIKHWKTTTKQCNEKDMDILMEIKDVLNSIQKHGASVELAWVKGHQDRGSHTLSTAAKMNIVADSMATAGLRQKNIKNNINFPTSKAVITIHGQLLEQSAVLHTGVTRE
jgi:ribonuclease HI